MPGVPSRVLAALAAAIGLLALAACGAADVRSGGVQLQAVNAYGGHLAAEGTPKPGGTLRIGMDREPASFDPTVQNANPAAFAVYDTLMRLTPEGTTEP